MEILTCDWLVQGALRESSGSIALEVVPRLSYYMQRVLVRIAREAQRLAHKVTAAETLIDHTQLIYSHIPYEYDTDWLRRWGSVRSTR